MTAPPKASTSHYSLTVALRDPISHTVEHEFGSWNGSWIQPGPVMRITDRPGRVYDGLLRIVTLFVASQPPG
ncbi:hypothetical protein GCM10017567_27150 [Amycolatopsis bullii]|uniref:Uncharacterized protein n=1 Tax=Amycolatopsis bullii TaxID=941987 RepID=A0ABQ3KAW3_9PSEU|nr:hypothetical protein GCM10017567_27150 [Amycolatopsis bullii]